MLEIRFHGRGGQGAVTSAEILAQAAIFEGKQARAFPSFGPERRGAPVTAFCRIDGDSLRQRHNIYTPDIVLVLDPSLLRSVNVADGLKPAGFLVINSERAAQSFNFNVKHVATVNASRIATEILKRPITNTIVLGALLRLLDVVAMDSLAAAVKHRFDEHNALLNIEAMHKAYAETAVYHKKDHTPQLTLEDEAAGTLADTRGVNASPGKKLFKADADYLWSELEPGCVVTNPGNSTSHHTGDWRSFIPELQEKRCIKCGICWIFCPDMAYSPSPDGFYIADMDYCKGCGICARECPTGAIRMAVVREPV